MKFASITLSLSTLSASAARPAARPLVAMRQAVAAGEDPSTLPAPAHEDPSTLPGEIPSDTSADPSTLPGDIPASWGTVPSGSADASTLPGDLSSSGDEHDYTEDPCFPEWGKVAACVIMEGRADALACMMECDEGAHDPTTCAGGCDMVDDCRASCLGDDTCKEEAYEAMKCYECDCANEASTLPAPADEWATDATSGDASTLPGELPPAFFVGVRHALAAGEDPSTLPAPAHEDPSTLPAPAHEDPSTLPGEIPSDTSADASTLPGELPSSADEYDPTEDECFPLWGKVARCVIMEGRADALPCLTECDEGAHDPTTCEGGCGMVDDCRASCLGDDTCKDQIYWAMKCYECDCANGASTLPAPADEWATDGTSADATTLPGEIPPAVAKKNLRA